MESRIAHLAGAANARVEPREVVHTTLLQLMQRITRETGDDQAAAEWAFEELRTGRARLTGNFRGVPVEVLDPNREPP